MVLLSKEHTSTALGGFYVMQQLQSSRRSLLSCNCLLTNFHSCIIARAAVAPGGSQRPEAPVPDLRGARSQATAHQQRRRAQEAAGARALHRTPGAARGQQLPPPARRAAAQQVGLCVHAGWLLPHCHLQPCGHRVACLGGTRALTFLAT